MAGENLNVRCDATPSSGGGVRGGLLGEGESCRESL